MFDRIQKNKDSSSNVWQQAVPFLGLVLVCIVFQIGTKGKLISQSNFKAFSNYAFQMVIPACGAVFLMSQGQLDFSMAGNVCICCILAAKASHINPWLTPVVKFCSSMPVIPWLMAIPILLREALFTMPHKSRARPLTPMLWRRTFWLPVMSTIIARRCVICANRDHVVWIPCSLSAPR